VNGRRLQIVSWWPAAIPGSPADQPDRVAMMRVVTGEMTR
jgi:hypothetical protein